MPTGKLKESSVEESIVNKFVALPGWADFNRSIGEYIAASKKAKEMTELKLAEVISRAKTIFKSSKEQYTKAEFVQAARVSYVEFLIDSWDLAPPISEAGTGLVITSIIPLHVYLSDVYPFQQILTLGHW